MRRSKEQTQLRILDAATAYNVRLSAAGPLELLRILGLTVPRTLLAPPTRCDRLSDRAPRQ
jgi:hypothetical protein